VIDRQKLVGWIMIVLATAYLAYFVKVRLFDPGPALATKEWVQFVGSIFLLMVGTMNVRLAARREQRQQQLRK
jgi:hypothetical protein